MLNIFSYGATPIISALFDLLGIGKIINELFTWDEEQCKVSPAKRIKALIINILDNRKPLYLVEEYFRKKDVSNLIGSDVKAADFNDDSLGKVLDMFHQANPLVVVSHIFLRALKIEKVNVDSVHGDTTSWSLAGRYDNNNNELNGNLPFVLAKGHSKDHRPDLKQFKYGLLVNKEKFPVFGQVFSGNIDDTKWNNNLISKMDEVTDVEYLSDIIYVADSKLTTKKNLQEIINKNKESECNIKFVSRLPGTFNLEEELIQRACQKDNFEESGKLSDSKNASNYALCSYIREIDGHRYRFVVVKSSQLKNRKSKTLKRNLKKEKDSLEEKVAKLEKKEFDSVEDAKEARNNFMKNNQSNFYTITTKIEESKKRKTRDVVGRPPTDYVPEYMTVYKIKAEVGSLDQKSVEKEIEKRGCFVLITNILDENECSNKDILKEYKNQSSVECSFKFIKDPTFVGSIFLEKPERVRAMAYLILIAYLIYIAIERRARLALIDETEPLTITGGIDTFTPTGNKILETLELSGLEIIYDERTKQREFPKNADIETLKRILDLLGLDIKIYLSDTPYYDTESKHYDTG